MLAACARRLAVAVLVFWVFIGVVGCFPFGPSTGSQHQCVDVGTNGHKPPSSTKPFIWIGTDDANGNYRPITPNETLAVQHGPQGGEHVWGAAHLYAAGSSDQWTLTFQIKGTDGSQIAAYEDILDACDTDLAETRRVTVRFDTDPALSMVSNGILMVDATPDGGKTTVHAEVPISWK